MLENLLSGELASKIADKFKVDPNSAFEMIRKQLPPWVVLMVSSECNAKCKHCYLPYQGSRSPEDTLDAVLKLQEAGHKVIIAGSENLLNLAYLNCYKAAGQDYILTNGLLLHKDKSLYQELKKAGIKSLELSLHFEVGNELNCAPETIVGEVITEAKKREFRVEINSIVTSKNYIYIKEICKRVMNYGADALYFGRFIPLGRGRDNVHLKLDDNMVSSAFRQIVEARSEYQTLKIFADGHFGPRPNSLGEILAKNNCYCPAGIWIAAIDPNNNVYGCPFTMGSEHIIGRFEDKITIHKQILPERRNTCIAHLLY